MTATWVSELKQKLLLYNFASKSRNPQNSAQLSQAPIFQKNKPLHESVDSVISFRKKKLLQWVKIL